MWCFEGIFEPSKNLQQYHLIQNLRGCGMKFMFLPLKMCQIALVQASGSGLSLVLSLSMWSPVWEIRGEGDWAHHLVHRQCNPRVQIPPHCQIRFLGAIREHRICMSPLGQGPGMCPTWAWIHSSDGSESRRHIPISVILLQGYLHALAEQLFGISFQNCYS